MSESKILQRELRYKGKAFSVYQYTADVEGQTVRRDIIERAHGVVAVPVDRDQNVLLLSEYCAGSNSFVLSLPGGKASGTSEQDFAAEAQRELREETGCRALQMIKLRFAYSHPSTSTRKSYVFLAYDLVDDPLPHSGEILKVVKLPLEEAIKACYEDWVSDVSTIGNLLMARDKLHELGH